MTDKFVISNPNCVSCKSDSKAKYLNEGKPYGSNIFKFVDSTDTNSTLFGAVNFYGFSFAEYGDLVYKVNNNKVDLQKIQFANLDTLYVTKSGENWVLGVK
jgi:hypothetical protein